jgi:cell division protein FtsI/penicillin-binding protein 2
MVLAVTVVFMSLLVRVAYIQIDQGRKYSMLSVDEVTSTVQVPALRGAVYSSDGRILEMSVMRTSVIADPLIIHHPAEEASVLSKILGINEDKLLALLTEHSGYVPLATSLSQSLANKIISLDLPGLSFSQHSVVSIPSGDIVEPVLGSVGWNGQGSSGLEYEYNSLLAGTPGTERLAISPSGLVMPGGKSWIKQPKPGSGLVLTINESLQYYLDQALSQEIIKSHARSGTAIVMDPHTGDILAMASLDSVPGSTPQPSPLNLATDMVYEPGSIFKIITFSGALEDHVITPSTTFIVPDHMVIDGALFHDAWVHPTQPMTATQIIAQSSNIGTIKIAEALGKYRLAQWISKFRLGKPTGLHFPGASPGIVLNPAKWSPTAIGSTPIGQDTGVTPLQMLDAMNVVANRGLFVYPRLVKAIVSPNGRVRPVASRPPKRIVSQSIEAELAGMIEHVVSSPVGTGVHARIPGYVVAGKTGTSQIPSHTRPGYVPGAFMATFGGFVPAQDPRLSAIVVLDRPTPIYGGSVSAPVFAQVMQYALRLFGIPPVSVSNTPAGTEASQPPPLSPITSPLAQPVALPMTDSVIRG